MFRERVERTARHYISISLISISRKMGTQTICRHVGVEKVMSSSQREFGNNKL